MTTGTRGFTLPEMMLALVISGIVLLIGRGVIEAIQHSRDNLQETRLARNRALNRVQWLREAFRTLDVGGEGQGSFDGGPERLVFSSRLLSASGWSEATRVTLGILNGRLQAVLSRGDTLELDEGQTGVAFDYLLEPGERSRWVREWRSPSTAPLAVRLRMQHLGPAQGLVTVDTLLVLIGERG